MKTDWQRFCEDYDVVQVCMSRDRADVLATHSDKLLPEGYTLFYSGDGYDDHDYRCGERIEVPRSVAGFSPVWNYALRERKERILIFSPDDIKRIYWMGGSKMFRLPPEQYPAVLVNLVVNALDVGATLFGLSEVDIRKTSPLSPFHTRSMLQGVVGVVGRGIWYDERNIHKADYDVCLQHIKATRFIWKDMRYFVSKDINHLRGGLMEFRSREREEEEVERLRQWWGDDIIRWTVGRTQRSLAIMV